VTGLGLILVSVLMMMGLAFCYAWIVRNIAHPVQNAVAVGMTFGVGVVCMLAVPIANSDWPIGDLRTLLAGVAVVVSGPLAGAIAVAFGLSYQLIDQGSLLSVGALSILLGFGLGGVWRSVVLGSSEPAWTLDAGFGAVVGTFLLSLCMFINAGSIPDVGLFAIVIVLAHILGAGAVGHVLRHEAERNDESDQLRRFAEIDPLTLLLNRRGTTLALQKLQGDPGRGHALLYFDVDLFKSINDRYGHLAGDAALAAVANRIRGVLRHNVIFSRHGGDEFTLYVPNITEPVVARIADRVRKCVSESPVAIHGHQLNLSISVGAYWTDNQESFEDMLLRADLALLQAKSMGRDQVSLGWLPVQSQLGQGKAGPSHSIH